MYLSHVFSPIFLGCVPIFDAFNFKPPFNKGLKQFVLPRGPGGSMLQGTAWSWRKKAAQTEKQRPSKSNRAVEDPMFFLENHWEIDTISGIVIASLEYRSVPKICSDYRILSLDVRIARAAVALRHQQLDGRWFWVSCYIVLIISKCVVAISLEDLGRSWKILEAWSSHPKLAIGPIRAIGFLRLFPRSTSRILEALAVGVELLLTSHGGTTMDLSWCNNV